MRQRSPTIYDRMDFPEYEFREYPKHVYPMGLTYPDDYSEAHLRGKPKPVEVHSETEERDVMSAENPLDSEAATRENLRRQLAMLGVQVDHSWGMGRLYQELAHRAQRLAAQHQSIPGEKAFEKDPGTVEWGLSPDEEDDEILRRESDFLGQRKPPDEDETPRPPRAADQDMIELREMAADLGLKVDGRWSADRLRSEIARVTDPNYEPSDGA